MAQNVHAAAVISRCRANPYYKRALEVSPQYIAVVALRAKLLEEQQNLPAAPAVAAPDSVDADFAAWRKAVAEAAAAGLAREAAFNAIRDKLIQCDKQIEDIATLETDRILGCLNDDLQAVMAKVADVVGRLAGATTPQQVIEAGVGEEWKQLQPLRNAYDGIRAAHLWAMAGEDQLTWSRSDYLFDDPLATDIAIRNLDDVFPGWKFKPNNVFRMSDAPEDDPRPWPTKNPLEQLLWLCTSAAEPWVPTLGELGRLQSEKRNRLDPPLDSAPENPYPKQQFARLK